MKSKFTILGFCALFALAALFVFGGKRPIRVDQGVVITPEGKLAPAPRRDAWTVTLDKPPAKTNPSGASTNSTSK